MRAARIHLALVTREDVADAATILERLADDLDAVAWNPKLFGKRFRSWNPDTIMAIEAHYLTYTVVLRLEYQPCRDSISDRRGSS